MKWNVGMLGCECIPLLTAVLTPNIFAMWDMVINDGN
jgi:hypothetical protein